MALEIVHDPSDRSGDGDDKADGEDLGNAWTKETVPVGRMVERVVSPSVGALARGGAGREDSKEAKNGNGRQGWGRPTGAACSGGWYQGGGVDKVCRWTGASQKGKSSCQRCPARVGFCDAQVESSGYAKIDSGCG